MARKVHTAEFKAKVALEAVRSGLTANQIASKYEVHAVQVSQWKKELLQNLAVVFEGKKGAYTHTEESIRGSSSLVGFPNPISEAKAVASEAKAVAQFCRVAMRCKDKPGQAFQEFMSLDNWKLVAEHQKTASFLAGAAHKFGKYQKDPFADVTYNVGKAMIACAPTVVGVAKTLGASLTEIDEGGEAGCQASN